MHFVIIGAKGQLGWELVRSARKPGRQITGLDLPEIDLTDASSVREQLGRSKGDMVINAAAYTAVDRAESQPEIVHAVNSEGPANLARSCRELGIPLIHVSTDYVFDGQKDQPYLESDPMRPIGVYGRSKAQGEIAVKEGLEEHIIIRTSWLYGANGHNFVKTMLKLGKERERISVINDQRGCPTYALDLAEALLAMAEILLSKRAAWGTYHYAGAGSATWFEFATKIFELARQHTQIRVKDVIPITSAEYPLAVDRPANSRLDCTKITRVFGIHPSPWAESLAGMIDEFYNRHRNF